jgi:hypothetical protein
VRYRFCCWCGIGIGCRALDSEEVDDGKRPLTRELGILVPCVAIGIPFRIQPSVTDKQRTDTQNMHIELGPCSQTSNS